MGGAMAKTTVGSAFVAAFPGKSVDPAGVIARLVLVTGGTDGFGNARGVWVFFVGFVAGFSGQPGVSTLLQLWPLVMARGTLHGRRRIRGFQIGAGCPEKKA